MVLILEQISGQTRIESPIEDLNGILIHSFFVDVVPLRVNPNRR